PPAARGTYNKLTEWLHQHRQLAVEQRELLNETGLQSNALSACGSAAGNVITALSQSSRKLEILECQMLVISTLKIRLEPGVKIWKADDFEQQVLRGTDSGRLLEYLASRNVTHKRVHIPNNSPAVSSLVGCVDKCSEVPACRGIVFKLQQLLSAHRLPRCALSSLRGSSELAVYEFHTVATQQCFETVNLRVSDALSFDRLWGRWLHTPDSAQPNNNRFRVDLLYWNDTYIYAYYLNVLILAESTNYMLSNFTFAAAAVASKTVCFKQLEMLMLT
uniref:RYDR_ITPR domain-containing protein n=1 Tax=Macrostomum lignano TaxID=282301 RepID=A0A1I8FHT4_9PLAT